MTMIIALCAGAMSSMTGAAVGSRRAMVPLLLTGAVYVGLFAASVWATAAGVGWAVWVFAAVAGVTITIGMVISDRRTKGREPAVNAGT